MNMIYKTTKRLIDICFVITFFCLTLPFVLFIFIIVKSTSQGPFIYWSKRIGKNNNSFFMPKIRTMKINTPQIATHLLSNPDKYLTYIGSFLRKTSLDELPQIWSILVGDMTVVGPRPALYNQYDLIEYRQSLGIDTLTPGLTGWAQINGRDDLEIKKKVDLDFFYLNNNSLFLDIKIIFLTFFVFFNRNNIKH